MRANGSSLGGLWRGLLVLFLLGVGLLGLREAAFSHARHELHTALASQGLTLEQASFDFSPTRGLVVREMLVGRPQGGNQQRLAEISEASLDFDLAELLRGRTELRQLRVRDAVLTLDAEDHPLRLDDIDAELLFLGSQVHLVDLEARYHGLAIHAHGSIERPGADGHGDSASSMRATLDEQSRVLANLEQIFDRVHLDPDASRLEIEFAPVDRPGEIRLEAHLDVSGARLAGVEAPARLDEVRARILWNGQELRVDDLHCRQDNHHLEGELLARPHEAHWEVSLESDLDLGRLTATLAPELAELPRGNPQLQLEGRWIEGKPDWSRALVCRGRFLGEGLAWRDRSIERLAGNFAWNGGEFHLLDAELQMGDSDLRGEVLWQGSRFEARVGGEAPLVQISEWLRPAGTPLPVLLRRADLDKPCLLDATLTGSGPLPADWTLDVGISPDRLDDPLADFLGQLARYRVTGTLEQPEWSIESRL